MPKKLQLIVNSPVIYVIAILSMVYAFTISFEPAFGDGISFTLSAISHWDFASNATNHMMYINLLRFLFLAIPAHPYVLFPLFSTISALIVIAIMYLNLRLLDFDKWKSALAVLLLGLSFTFWRHALVTEVYTFNLIFTSVFIWLYLKFNATKSIKYIYIMAVIWAISTWVHIQNILLLPALFYCFYKQGLKHFFILSTISSLLFLCLFIPSILGFNTISSVFFDNEFKDEVLGFSLFDTLKGLAKGIGFTVFNFGIASILIIYGLTRKKFLSQHITFWSLIFFPVFGFAARYNVSDNYVFFLQSYLVLIIAFAYALKSLNVKIYMIFLIVLMQPLFYFLSTKMAVKSNWGATIQNQKAYKGGLRFFLWPGMRQNPSPFDVLKAIEEQKLDLHLNPEIEPNIIKAKKLLQLEENNFNK